MHLFDLARRNKRIQCYAYCIGLNYDRKIGIKQQHWEKEDVNVIAALILQDLEKLNIPAKIVDKSFIPFGKVNMLALKVGIKMKRGEYLYYSNYHIIIKKQDGYWYSKFKDLEPERLPFNTDIELWDWQAADKSIKKKFYNSNIVYIAITRP